MKNKRDKSKSHIVYHSRDKFGSFSFLFTPIASIVLYCTIAAVSLSFIPLEPIVDFSGCELPGRTQAFPDASERAEQQNRGARIPLI